MVFINEGAADREHMEDAVPKNSDDLDGSGVGAGDMHTDFFDELSDPEKSYPCVEGSCRRQREPDRRSERSSSFRQRPDPQLHGDSPSMPTAPILHDQNPST